MSGDFFIDTETFSPVDLGKGLARYSSQGEVMIVTSAMGEEEVALWDVTASDIIPPGLLDRAERCKRVIAHNAAFDQTMVEADPRLRPLAERFAGKWFCTMAMALRHGLPGGLDKLSHIFKLPEEFHKLPGKDFINLFCKLQKGKPRATRLTHPAQWRDGLTYARQDIRAMREIYYLCPSWNDSNFEIDLWHLDQRINRRGVAVDVKFATQAVRARKSAQERNAERTQELTEDTVLRATQRDKLLQFIFVEHGVTLPDLRADTVERRLEDPELPELLKELLRIRLSSSKSSTAKYARLLALQFGGRLHWLLQYCGAIRTKRWGGRNFQPQNLKRPTMEFSAIEAGIEAVLSGCEDLLLDDVMETLSSAIRSVLVAGPGKKLISADLSNIEGRFLPWVAGEEWQLENFRLYDRGLGPDLYKVTYGKAFNVDPGDVSDFQRQIGKVLELAFAIGGGVGACVTAAATYHIDLEELAAAVHLTAPRNVLLDAEETYQWAKRKWRTLGLDQHIYGACEALKCIWRDARPATVKFWDDCGRAATAAVCNPGTVYPVGKYIEFDKRGVWLRLKLPSGGYLSYPNVGLDEQGDGLTYMAWNVYRKGWYKERTWGAKFASDVRQGGARDCMAARMQPAEDAGYPIVLTVHDELLTETPDDPRFTAEELSSILATHEAWNAGLPLAADGHEMQRYHKR